VYEAWVYTSSSYYICMKRGRMRASPNGSAGKVFCCSLELIEVDVAQQHAWFLHACKIALECMHIFASSMCLQDECL